MNRLPHLLDDDDVDLFHDDDRVAVGSLSRTTAGSLRHQLFIPLHYEPNYAYPLLIWLHGDGGDERQLQRIMPLLSMRNFVAIGPAGVSQVDENSPRAGLTWLQSPADIGEAEQAVADSIEVATSRCHIARRRIFLAGYGAGGTMAIRVALNRPERFAGALSLCGPFPSGFNPLHRLAAARTLPMMIGFGRDGAKHTQSETCRELRLFHAAGMNVDVRQYPCGDELTTTMLEDVNRWVMEQVTGAPSDADRQANRHNG